jgi:hypothetical protein
MLDMPSNKACRILLTPTLRTLCLIFLLDSQFFVIKSQFYISNNQPFSTHGSVNSWSDSFLRSKATDIFSSISWHDMFTVARPLVLHVVGYRQVRLDTTVKSAASVCCFLLRLDAGAPIRAFCGNLGRGIFFHFCELSRSPFFTSFHEVASF